MLPSLPAGRGTGYAGRMPESRLAHGIAIDGIVVEWRGPAPFYFVSLPEACAAALRFEAKRASYGWGCIPVLATIGEVDFATSLIPRNGIYLLPLRIAVRRTMQAAPGDRVHAILRVAPSRRGGGPI